MTKKVPSAGQSARAIGGLATLGARKSSKAHMPTCQQEGGPANCHQAHEAAREPHKVSPWAGLSWLVKRGARLRPPPQLLSKGDGRRQEIQGGLSNEGHSQQELFSKPWPHPIPPLVCPAEWSRMAATWLRGAKGTAWPAWASPGHPA